MKNNLNKKNLLIAAGGTGGHIIPAIIIGNYLRDYNIIYICGNRKIEKDIYTSFNIKPIFLDIPSYKTFIILFYLCINIPRIIRIILHNNINNILMMGSYVTFPIGIAALLLNKPLYLMEQDSIAGKVIKIFSLFAKKVFVGFDKKYHGIKKEKIIYVGHTIRESAKLQNITKKLFQNNKKTILIIGGSQGAYYMSRKLLDALKGENYNIILVAGNHYDKFKENKNIKIYPFYPNLGELYSQSDIIISRGSALTMAEILDSGKPALFIPLRIATNNHQLKNILLVKKHHPHIDYIKEEHIKKNILLEKLKNIENKTGIKRIENKTESIIKDILENYV